MLQACFCLILSAIRIFCFEGHSALRCSITSKTSFYKSPLGVPGKHLGGAELGHCISGFSSEDLGFSGFNCFTVI